VRHRPTRTRRLRIPSLVFTCPRPDRLFKRLPLKGKPRTDETQEPASLPEAWPARTSQRSGANSHQTTGEPVWQDLISNRTSRHPPHHPTRSSEPPVARAAIPTPLPLHLQQSFSVPPDQHCRNRGPRPGSPRGPNRRRFRTTLPELRAHSSAAPCNSPPRRWSAL
jgi:hypothetical protein